MSLAVGRGCGKLILVGEHAVVYGHPAIAFAVDRWTEVTVRPADGFSLDAASDDADCVAMVRDAVGEAAVRVRSDVPMARGMGSSAALAVATERAAAAWHGRLPELSRALAAVRRFHGPQASGVDVQVSWRGGVSWYRKGPPVELVPLDVPDGAVVVLDSGRPGRTVHTVAAVAANRHRNGPTLEAIGELVAAARDHLGDPAALGAVLTENHARLVELGVSTPDLDALVALALDHGALGAKLSGGGGGGVVIAWCADPTPVLAAADAAGIAAFVTRPSQEECP